MTPRQILKAFVGGVRDILREPGVWVWHPNGTWSIHMSDEARRYLIGLADKAYAVIQWLELGGGRNDRQSANLN